MKLGDAAIDWGHFVEARHRLGQNFPCEMSHLSIDGSKAVAAIEDALRSAKAHAIIKPAGQLKAEAFRLGAQSLADLAEDIECGARDCVEWGQGPKELANLIAQLRPTFAESVNLLENRANRLN